MINLQKRVSTNNENRYFSILIPTWNNLSYLKLCVNSIKKNSHYKHQIIVVVNEGTDGTFDYVRSNSEIDFVYSKENIGICYGLNSARSLIQTRYIVYANDDMYFLPDWDLALWDEIQAVGHHYFMLSSTMIEPLDTGNSCVIVQNHGTTIETFREDDLLKAYKQPQKKDWHGSTWPPNVVALEVWDLVGGMSAEFSPGMYSDPDLSKKLWDLGIRYFKGLADSRVYHFGSKSTVRIKKNKGATQFLSKWGIDSSTFTSLYLKRGTPFTNTLTTPAIPFWKKIKIALKKIKHIKNYG